MSERMTPEQGREYDLPQIDLSKFPTIEEVINEAHRMGVAAGEERGRWTSCPDCESGYITVNVGWAFVQVDEQRKDPCPTCSPFTNAPDGKKGMIPRELWGRLMAAGSLRMLVKEHVPATVLKAIDEYRQAAIDEARKRGGE